MEQVQISEEIRNLGEIYIQLYKFLDSISKYFNIFIDTSVIYYFPYKNGDVLDFLFKSIKDPENLIFDQKNKYELIEIFGNHLDSLNKRLEEKYIFITPEINDEIKVSLRVAKNMIKSNPLEIKLKKRKIHFRHRSFRQKKSTHIKPRHRKTNLQYIKLSRSNKKNFYPNQRLYLFKKIRKKITKLRENLRIAPSLEEQPHFDLAKNFFLNYREPYTMTGQPSKADISLLVYSLEYSLSKPAVCISTDKHISKLLNHLNNSDEDLDPKSFYFNNSKGLILFKFLINDKKFKKKSYFLETKERRLIFKKNKIMIYDPFLTESFDHSIESRILS